MKFIYVCLILQLASVLVEALPSGAPLSACNTMEPRHGVSPQDNTASPYSITVNSNEVYRGQSVTVTLNSDNNEQFRGILLQARPAPDGDAIGSWDVPNSNYQAINCGGFVESALTHTSRSDKNTNVSFTWNVPESFAGSAPEHVFIYGTIVQEYAMFYVMLPSAQINILDTTTAPDTTANPTTISITTAASTTEPAATVDATTIPVTIISPTTAAASTATEIPTDIPVTTATQITNNTQPPTTNNPTQSTPNTQLPTTPETTTYSSTQTTSTGSTVRPSTTTRPTTTSAPPMPPNSQCDAEYKEALRQWRELFQEYMMHFNQWKNDDNQNCYN